MHEIIDGFGTGGMDRNSAGLAVRQRGWLSTTSEEFQNELLRRADLLPFPRGTTLYNAGDDPGGLFGVAAGLIGVSLPPREPDGSLIHLQGPGFWSGEAAALVGSTRLISMIAARDSWCWRLSRSTAQTMLADDPTCWRWFGTISLTNLIEALALIDALTTMAPARRVAKMLLRLVVTEPDGRTMVAASQAEIGEIAGLTRKMVHTVLRDFHEQGWVARRYGTVEILDLDRLRGFASQP